MAEPVISIAYCAARVGIDQRDMILPMAVFMDLCCITGAVYQIIRLRFVLPVLRMKRAIE
jgi:hypothetical protein